MEVIMTPEIIPGKLGPWTTFRIAWRNLARNRKRTWITATTVALAVLLLQFTIAMFIGLERQSYENLINYQTGHAKLYAEGYFDERDEFPLDYALSDLEGLQSVVRSVPGVAASTPRLTFSAQISNGVDQIPCLGIGIQVSGSDTDVFLIPQAVVDGEYLKPDEEGLLLGSGLAEMFNVSTGDWLTVLAKTQAGAYEAIDLPITGLVGTGNPLIDQGSILLPLETARYMLDMEEAATELAIRFSVTASENRTLTSLRETIEQTANVEVKGWRDVEEDFLAFAQMKRMGSIIMLGIFVILAVVGIANTILMAAYERTREIGMMMALGLRGGGIRRLFLIEGALAGLVGGAIGSLCALVFILYFVVYGWDLTAMYGDMDIGYPVKDILYFDLNLGTMFVTWLLAGVLAAVASYLPAARASRQDPVEALHYV